MKIHEQSVVKRYRNHKKEPKTNSELKNIINEMKNSTRASTDVNKQKKGFVKKKIL